MVAGEVDLSVRSHDPVGVCDRLSLAASSRPHHSTIPAVCEKVRNNSRQNTHTRCRRSPKKSRSSRHHPVVPRANCRSRRFDSPTYLLMYAVTVGFSLDSSGSWTSGSSGPANYAKNLRSERSWWIRMVRIVFTFWSRLKSSSGSGTARHESLL